MTPIGNFIESAVDNNSRRMLHTVFSFKCDSLPESNRGAWEHGSERGDGVLGVIGDKGTRGLGDLETWGLGDKGTWRLGEKTASPPLLVSLSPSLLVSLSPCLPLSHAPNTQDTPNTP